MSRLIALSVLVLTVTVAGAAGFRDRKVPGEGPVAVAAKPAAEAPASSTRTTKDRVADLLEIGWQRTLKARTEADRRYQRLLELAPADRRVTYAYALIQLRQLRYPEAAKLLDEVLVGDKRNLAAWQTRVWLSALTKEYENAMLEMQRLAELLPAEEARGVDEQPNHDVAVFLGRLCGYFEGPAKESVDAGRVASCRQRIMSRLTSTRQTAFDEARREVLNQYSGVTADAEQKSVAAKAAAEKQKEKTLSDLAQKQEQANARAADAEARTEEVKKQLTYEWEKITGDQRRVVDEYRRVEANAVAWRQDLQGIDNRIAQLLALADQEKDPNQRQRYLDDAAVWRVRRNRPMTALANLDAQAAALNSQQASLTQQRREIEVRYQREVGSLDKLHANLQRLKTTKDKVENQQASGNTPQVRDQKKRSTALTTYLPLPISLEAERQRLLESF